MTMQKSESVTSETEIPAQFAFDIKLELTAKGIRPTIHVRGNDELEVRATAIRQYLKVVREIELEGLFVAPVEIKETKA